jgi:hypothetical protein
MMQREIRYVWPFPFRIEENSPEKLIEPSS